MLTIVGVAVLDVYGHQLRTIGVSSFEDQPGVPAVSLGGVGVDHLGRVHQEPIRLAAQTMQRLKYHNRAAQVRSVRHILGVGELGPVDLVVGEGRGPDHPMLTLMLLVGTSTALRVVESGYRDVVVILESGEEDEAPNGEHRCPTHQRGGEDLGDGRRVGAWRAVLARTSCEGMVHVAGAGKDSQGPRASHRWQGRLEEKREEGFMETKTQCLVERGR
jgi:hypothetical protein